MEDLIDIVKLISRQKISKVEIIGNSINSESKLNRFYLGIVQGKFKNEEDASNELYDTNPNNPNFKKLKYRLQDRLLNTLLFIDVNKPHFKDLQRAYYSCQRALSVVNILFGFNVRGPAVRIAENTIKKAIKFEHTEIILSLSRRLSRHYGAIEGDFKKYEYYKAITKEYLEIYNAEVLASEYYNEIAIYNTTSVGLQNNQEIAKKAQEYSNHLQVFLTKIDTYNFVLFAYSVFWFKDVIAGDYFSGLELCKQAVARVENDEKYPPKLTFLFYSRMLTCYTQLNDFELGEKAFQNALKYVDTSLSNLFIINRTYFFLAFRAKKYQKTFKILQEVKQHENYGKMPRNLQELWKLNEAYVQFFILINKIDVKELDEKFKINRFLNDVPLFSKDKRGINISILIIQFLFLLQQKKYGEVIDKVETLNVYCYRYLKKDHTFRSNCFIKMLLILPKCNFHRIAVERKSKTLFEKLQSVPLEIARQSVEIEIVPYEDLWGIVMDMLEAKFYKH